MFLLAAIFVGVAGAAVAVGASLMDETETQFNNWVSKKDDLQQQIKDLNREVKRHLNEAQYSIDIAVLKSDRRASIKLANTAYVLYDDAKHSLQAFGRNIVKTKKEINKYYIERKETKDKARKAECTREIKNLKEYKVTLHETNDSLKAEKENYYQQLKKLNQQTAKLRDTIEGFFQKRKRSYTVTLFY